MYVRSSSKAVIISPSEVLEVLKSVVTHHTYYDMATTMVVSEFSEFFCLVCHAGPSTNLQRFLVICECLNCSVARQRYKMYSFLEKWNWQTVIFFVFTKFQIELFSALVEQLMM